MKIINTQYQYNTVFYTVKLFSLLVLIICLLSPYAAFSKDKGGKNGVYFDKSKNELSARFKKVEIGAILGMIAREAGYSIIIHDDVKGKVAVEFSDVSINEAFKSVLNMGQLDMVKDGNIVSVFPKEHRVSFRSFDVNNVNVENILDTLKNLFDNKANIQIEPNTNLVLVTAPLDILREVESIISKIDVSRKQVMVEAAIVEVTLNDENKTGVNLGAILNKSNYSSAIQTSGFAINPLTSSNPVGFFAQGDLFTGASDKSVDALLEALQTVSDTKVLSHPKVIGVSGKQAEIIVGRKLGFRVTTTTNTGTLESIDFLEVGTQLKFTPYITQNGDVIMDIFPKVSDGAISETGLPSETTTEISTRVRVASGKTIVLGGLIRERKSIETKKVPLLGDIPILGWLFRRNVDISSRSEILILLTPKLVDQFDSIQDGKKKIDRLIGINKDNYFGEKRSSEDAKLIDSNDVIETSSDFKKL